MAAVAAWPAFTQSGPASLNISGGLFQPNGQPVNQTNVDFRIEIWDKAGTCILFTEEHPSQDLSQTKGGFALALGRGLNGQNKLEGGSVLTSKIFENSGAVGPFTDCAGGLTLASGDDRLIRVHYNLGSGYVAMTPDVPLASSAYAMVAETLSGKRAGEFIQVKDDATNDLNQANVESVFSSINFARLSALLAGTSSQYLSSNPGSPVFFNDQRLTNIAAPVLSTDGATKGYADSYIGGKGMDLSGIGPMLGGGRVLMWDATNSRWETGTPNAIDGSKLPLAGGTMTGPITLGGYDLFAAGNVNISPQNTLQLGTFTNASESPLAAGDKGKTWYNTDLNAVRVWDGTTARTQAYLDGTGKLNSSWIPNLPAVDGSSLTNLNAVRLQGRDVASTAPNGGEVLKWNNGAWTPMADLGITGLTGDVVATGSGSVSATINSNAITTGKIANDAVTSAKINSTGNVINRLLITDGATGGTVTYATCALDEVMKWTALGWQCASVASLSAVTSVAGKTGSVSLNINDIDGWGTAALRNVGTAAGELVELDAGGRIPSSLLPTGTGDITDVIAGPGLQGGGSSGSVTLSVDVALLSNVNAVSLQGRMVASLSPSPGQFLGWNGSQWEPTTSSTSFPLAGAGGTASAPTYSFTGDMDTGWYSPGAGILAASTDQTERIRISADGNVGIGVQTPGSVLEVRGDMFLNHTLTAPIEGTKRWAFVPQMTIDTTLGNLTNYDSVSEHDLSIVGNGSIDHVSIVSSYAYNFSGNATINHLAGFEVDDHDLAGVTVNNYYGFRSKGANYPTNSYAFYTDQNAGPSHYAFYAGGTARSFFGGQVGIGTNNPMGALDVESLGTMSALIVPRATTANRPQAGYQVNGMIRYNTTTNKFEAYENGAWSNMISAGTTFPLAGNAGSAAAPTYSFSGDTGTGWFSPAAGILAASTSQTERVRITDVGFVGIGTTTPQGPLHVVGGVPIFERSGRSLLFNPNFGGGNTHAVISTGEAVAPTNMDLRLQAGNDDSSNGVVIKSTGHVGVGTDSPFSKLEVTETSTSLARGITISQYSSSAHEALFTGRKARGTPASPASVQSGDYVSGLSGSVYDGSAYRDTGWAGFQIGGAVSTGVVPTDFTVWTGPSSSSEKFRVTSAGKVGIGTTDPLAGLDVATSGTAASALIVPRDSTANRPSGVNGMIRYNTSTASLEGFVNGGWSTIAGAAGGSSIWSLNGSSAYYNGGNIGIGTSSPQGAISVTGGNSSKPYLSLESTDTGNTYIWQMFSSGIYNATSGYDRTNAPWEFGLLQGGTSSQPSDRLYIGRSGVSDTDFAVTRDGYVGIGTGLPGEALTVRYNGASVNGLGLANSAGRYWVLGDQAGPGVPAGTFAITDSTASAPRFVINNLGNVGIGTTAPVGALTLQTNVVRDWGWHSAIEIPSTGNNNYPAIFFSNLGRFRDSGVVWTASSSGDTRNKIGAEINSYFTTDTNANMEFWTNNDVGTTNPQLRMVITGAGNVGIGDSNPAKMLTVGGDADVSGDISEGGQLLRDKYIGSSSFIDHSNPFGANNVYLGYFNNGLYRADSRFDVTATGFASFNAASLFRGTSDNYGNRISAGDTGVVTIDLIAKGEFDANGITYPQGKIFVSFYYSDKPAAVSGRVMDRTGTWRALASPTDISKSPSLGLWELTVPGFNYMTKIELTITAAGGNDAQVAHIEYLGDRTSFPIATMSKYGENTLYDALYFADSNNSVNAWINRDGKASFAGSVRVGSDGSGCTGTNLGAVRVNGTALEFCDGSAWVEITTGGSGYLTSSGGTLSGGLVVNAGTSEGVKVTNSNDTPYALMINNTTYGSTDAKGLGFWQNNTGEGNISVNGQSNQLVLGTNGSIGIGTSSPSSLLHLRGVRPRITLEDTSGSTSSISSQYNQLALDIAGSGNYMLLVNGGNNFGTGDYYSQLYYGTNSNTSYGVFEAYGAKGTVISSQNFGGVTDGIIFAPNRSEKMRVSTNGRVGIGTNDPGSILHIGTYGNAGASRTLSITDASQSALNYGTYPGSWTSALEIQSNDNSRAIWMSPMDTDSTEYARLTVLGTGLDLFTGATVGTQGNRVMTLTSGGQVGIGTRSPNGALEILNTNNSFPDGWNNTLKLKGTYPSLWLKDTTSDDGYLIAQDSGNLYFMTETADASPSYKATLTSAGRLGIGTLNPATKLDVKGGIIGEVPGTNAVTFFKFDPDSATPGVTIGVPIPPGYAPTTNLLTVGTVDINGGSSAFGNAGTSARGIYVPITTHSLHNDFGIDVSVAASNFATPTGVRSVVTNNPTAARDAYAFYADASNTNGSAYAFYANQGSSYFGGNVGINTVSPGTNLDVNGGIRAGTQAVVTAACSGTTEGVLRYNNTSHNMEYCDGTIWRALNAVAGSTVPNNFSFSDQTGAALASTVNSNAVTLGGFTGSLTATCVGCTAIARNGAWGGTTVVGFQAGDTIAIRVTSSASMSTAVTAYAVVGATTSATWTVTTTAATTNAFSFTDVTEAATSWTYTSNTVTLSGFAGSLTATCGNACVSIARNGVWGGPSVAGFVDGDTIAIRATSASTTGGSVNANVTVGATTSGTWTITNAVACQAGITVGQACPDGSIYAGQSTDGNVPMYTTPCDGTSYWDGSACVACASGKWTGSGTTCNTTWGDTWNNGSSSFYTTGFTSSNTGKANTAGLVALSSSDSPYQAANYCASLSAYGHNDWYLPALSELNVLYLGKAAIGNLSGNYQSSTESGNMTMVSQDMDTGAQDGGSYWGSFKTISRKIRCVRR